MVGLLKVKQLSQVVNVKTERKNVMTYSIQQIREGLEKAGYVANDEITTALWASVSRGRPLLLEGAAGTGKTSLAKALADGLNLPYQRLQMYEGLSDDKILYDYDYQKQLLVIEMLKPRLMEECKEMNLKEAEQYALSKLDFYGDDFLLERPVLKAIRSKKQTVLCIDELDKADEATEYMLYEFLENYSLSIPQYGTVTCRPDQRPIVIITSNGYRELSGPLRRRCSYLYLKRKKTAEMAKILALKANADRNLALGIALVVSKMTNLHYQPSLAEAIDYARFLSQQEDVSKETALSALSILLKDNRDYDRGRNLLLKHGGEIWSKGSDDEDNSRND